MKTTESGFIAIISVVIIGALLMVMSFSLSMSGFFARANMTDTESKEQSLILAEACGQDALFKIASDSTYNPINKNLAIGSDHCTIVSITGSPKIITTQATFQGATTTIQITAGPGNLSFTSWQELP